MKRYDVSAPNTPTSPFMMNRLRATSRTPNVDRSSQEFSILNRSIGDAASSTRLMGNSPLRLTSKRSVLRYALSDAPTAGNNSPRRRGPLLTSVDYKSNLSTYTDVKSPGLTSRILQYEENTAQRSPTPTHQAKYNRPGVFPIVHFFKKDPPVRPIERQVTVKLASHNVYNQNLESMGNGVSETLQTPNHSEEVSSKNFLDALKEISRKRIQGESETETNNKLAKRIEYNLNEYSKRPREDSPPQKSSEADGTSTMTSPGNQAPKRYCVVDPVFASQTSYNMFVERGLKHKLDSLHKNIQDGVVQTKMMKLNNAETQTLEDTILGNNESNVSTGSNKENTSISTPALETSKSTEEMENAEKESAKEEQVPLRVFDDKPLQFYRNRRVAYILGALSGEKPNLPSLDEIRKQQTNPKEKANVKHVSFKTDLVSELKPETEKSTSSPSGGDNKLTFTSITIKPSDSTDSCVSKQSEASVSKNTESAPITSMMSNTSTITVSGSGWSLDSSPSSPSNITNVAAVTASSPPQLENTAPKSTASTLLSTTTPTFAFGASAPVVSSSENPIVSITSPTSASKVVMNLAFGASPSAKLSTLKPSITFGGEKREVSSSDSKLSTLSNLTTTSTPMFSFGSNAASSPVAKEKPTSGKIESTVPSFGGFSAGTSSLNQTEKPTFGFNLDKPTDSTVSSTSTSASSGFGSSTSSQLRFDVASSAPTFGTSSTSTTSAPTFGIQTSAPAPAFSTSFGSSKPTIVTTEAASLPAFGATTTSALNTAPTLSVTTPSSTTTVSTAPSFSLGKSITSTSLTFGAVTTTASSTFGSATSSAPPAYGSTASSSIFGTPSAQKPTFGALTTTAAPTFGTPTTSAAFGASLNTTTAAFGTLTTTSAATASSAFGSTSFGASTTTFGESKPTFAFGATAPTTSAPPAFGATTVATNNVFGGFGAAAPTTTTAAGAPFAFGTKTSTSSTFGTSVGNFGGTAENKPAFGQASTENKPSAGFNFSFSAPNTANVTPFAFGGADKPKAETAVTTAASVFGSSTFGSQSFGNSSFGASAASTDAGFAFGKTTTTTTAAPMFSGTTTTSGFGTAPNNIFGSSLPNSGGFAFGAAATAAPSNSTPSQPFAFGSGAQPSAPATNISGGATFAFGGAGSAFGAASASTPSFGAPSATNKTTASVFGATAAPPAFGLAGSSSSTFGFGAGASNSTINSGNSQNQPFAFNSAPAPSAAPAASGVFSFGGATPAPANPAPAGGSGVFAFGNTATPQAFNFSGAPGPSTAPTFGQFGGAAPPAGGGMFSIGSGSTGRPRPQLKAKRRGI